MSTKRIAIASVASVLIATLAVAGLWAGLGMQAAPTACERAAKCDPCGQACECEACACQDCTCGRCVCEDCQCGDCACAEKTCGSACCAGACGAKAAAPKPKGGCCGGAGE